MKTNVAKLNMAPNRFRYRSGRRDHVVNLVIGNRHPFAVHFDFVVVANHATLGRATIHQVAARTLAVNFF